MTYFAFEDLAITRMISILLDNSDGLGQSVWCGVVKQLPHNTGTSISMMFRPFFNSLKLPVGIWIDFWVAGRRGTFKM